MCLISWTYRFDREEKLYQSTKKFCKILEEMQKHNFVYQAQ